MLVYHLLNLVKAGEKSLKRKEFAKFFMQQ